MPDSESVFGGFYFCFHCRRCGSRRRHFSRLACSAGLRWSLILIFFITGISNSDWKRLSRTGGTLENLETKKGPYWNNGMVEYWIDGIRSTAPLQVFGSGGRVTDPDRA